MKLYTIVFGVKKPSKNLLFIILLKYILLNFINSCVFIKRIFSNGGILFPPKIPKLTMYVFKLILAKHLMNQLIHDLYNNSY